jgi:putative transposase
MPFWMNRKPYATDVTDHHWELLEPLIPAARPGGRPRTVDLREVYNGIAYLLRAGCAWRLLPHDLPPWQTVYYYFRRWQRDGTWDTLHQVLHAGLRAAEGRHEEPSAAILDSQSVKTTSRGGVHGYDAGKKVNGRKRHLLVDTLGLVLAIVVTAANVQDRDGAKLVLAKAQALGSRLQVVWADGAYGGELIAWVLRCCGWVLQTILRPVGVKGFVLLPKRWVVERTFAWLARFRRLSKDYEYHTDTSETMVKVAMIQVMVRRL